MLCVNRDRVVTLNRSCFRHHHGLAEVIRWHQVHVQPRDPANQYNWLRWLHSWSGSDTPSRQGDIRRHCNDLSGGNDATSMKTTHSRRHRTTKLRKYINNGMHGVFHRKDNKTAYKLHRSYRRALTKDHS